MSILSRNINLLLNNMQQLCDWEKVSLSANILTFQNCKILMTLPPFTLDDNINDTENKNLSVKKRYKKGMFIEKIDIHLIMKLNNAKNDKNCNYTIVFNYETDKEPWCYIIEEELIMQWLLSSGRLPEPIR